MFISTVWTHHKLTERNTTRSTGCAITLRIRGQRDSICSLMELSGAWWTNIQTVDQWYCAVHTHTQRHRNRHRHRLRTWMTAEWSTRTLRSCILVRAIWLARGPLPAPPVSSFPAAGKARRAETTVSGTSHYSYMLSTGLAIRHNTNNWKCGKFQVHGKQ